MPKETDENEKARKGGAVNDITLDLDAVNDVIHGRLRMGIMAYLSAVNPSSFPELLEKTGASNGNLSTHLTKLESAEFVRLEKGFNGKRPQTLIYVTDKGRQAWIDYLDVMRRILET